MPSRTMLMRALWVLCWPRIHRGYAASDTGYRGLTASAMVNRSRFDA